MVYCGYCFARKNALKERHIGTVKAVKTVNGKDCNTAKTSERQKASRSDNRKPFARTNIYIVGKPNKRAYMLSKFIGFVDNNIKLLSPQSVFCGLSCKQPYR